MSELERNKAVNMKSSANPLPGSISDLSTTTASATSASGLRLNNGNNLFGDVFDSPEYCLGHIGLNPTSVIEHQENVQARPVSDFHDILDGDTHVEHPAGGCHPNGMSFVICGNAGFHHVELRSASDRGCRDFLAGHLKEQSPRSWSA